MTLADDPHLVERIARLAAFHDLPTPVVVTMAMMASELHKRPVLDVHDTIQARIRSIRRPRRSARPVLRLVRDRA